MLKLHAADWGPPTLCPVHDLLKSARSGGPAPWHGNVRAKWDPLQALLSLRVSLLMFSLTGNCSLSVIMTGCRSHTYPYECRGPNTLMLPILSRNMININTHAAEVSINNYSWGMAA